MTKKARVAVKLNLTKTFGFWLAIVIGGALCADLYRFLVVWTIEVRP